MRDTTFGNSDSAILLTAILDTNPSYRKKVSAMLHEMNTVNNELIKSNLPKSLKKSFLRTTLERFKSKASNIDVKEVKTFTQNVIKQNYRKSLDKL